MIKGEVAEGIVKSINDLLESSYTVSDIFESSDLGILRDYVETYGISRLKISGCVSIMSRSVVESLEDIIDWKYVSHYVDIDSTFIRRFGDYLDWNRLCKYHYLSEDFIEEIIDKVQWNSLFGNRRFDTKFLDKYYDRYWGSNSDIEYTLMTTQCLSSEFIESHWKDLDKILLCKTQTLGLDLLKNHITELPDRVVAKYQRNFDKDLITNHFGTPDLLRLLISNMNLKNSIREYIKNVIRMNHF